MDYEVEGARQEADKKDLERGCAKDCQARHAIVSYFINTQNDYITLLVTAYSCCPLNKQVLLMLLLQMYSMHDTHTHTHTTVLRLCGICPGQPR